MTDHLLIEVDDEYEGVSRYATADRRVGNITAVALRHNVEPGELAAMILCKVFDNHSSGRMVNMCDLQSPEHLVARVVVMAGISLVPTIERIEGSFGGSSK